jgi:hypothetical protein
VGFEREEVTNAILSWGIEIEGDGHRKIRSKRERNTNRAQRRSDLLLPNVVFFMRESSPPIINHMDFVIVVLSPFAVAEVVGTDVVVVVSHGNALN